MSAINDIREANPIASGAGELGGLFLGAGKGITALGEAAEHGVSSRLGGGLLGHIASMSARGALESAALGAQHEITEETLGDHDYNAEAIFSNAAKEGFLGAGVGGGLGLLGYGLGKARGLVGAGALGAKRPGPIADAALDEIAGVDGAGRGVRDQAARSQAAVEGFQRTGATSEQATNLAQDLETMGKARSRAGLGAGLIDDAAERYAAMHGGERGDLIRQHYADSAKHALDADAVLDTQARKLADAGTRAMRGLEDTVNEVHFTERPEQFAKLADAATYTQARDSAIRMGQDLGSVIAELDATPTKGGGEVALNKLKKHLTEFTNKMGALPADATATSTGEAMVNAYKLKQAVEKYSGFGKPAFMRTPAESEFADLYERMRVGLEDTASFGAAGDANREWNESFSSAKGRRDDFGRRFSVSVDQVSGVPQPELDAGKLKGFLSQLGGAESDQAVKSTEAMIDGMRSRADKIAKYADLSPAQQASLARGRAALDEFASVFQNAQKEASAANRLRAATLEERGTGLGGLLGIVGDTVTRPLESVRRLAQVRQGVDSFESGVRSFIRRYVDAGETVGSAVHQTPPRPKAETIREMEKIREIAASPARLQQAADAIVGDLGKHAPKTADALRLTAQRILLYLAREAPPASSSYTGFYGKPEPRYSDMAVHTWETKRSAALDAKTIVADLTGGHINRDAIEAVRIGQPRAFARIQALARDELDHMRRNGLLDDMNYQELAPFATLLGVPPDQTWTPEFIAAMQAAKSAPPAADSSGLTPDKFGRLPRKSNQKPLADQLMTEAAKIESGGQG